jgi:predicted DNA-binding protein (UPF0251 family)
MPRPCKNRKIYGKFNADYFKPRGVPVSSLAEVILDVDELEALRLADLEEMYQNDAAEKMGVSRQTFGNIVKRARQKVADALINGKALLLITPDSSDESALRCNTCGLVWINTKVDEKLSCPSCESQEIIMQGCGRGRGKGCCGGRGKGRRFQ